MARERRLFSEEFKREAVKLQNGTPLYDLQEMGGWKSAEMLRRYAHLPAQTAKHAAVISALLHDTNTAQEELERLRRRQKSDS